MKRTVSALSIVAFLSIAHGQQPDSETESGPLFVMGGGAIPKSILERFLESAGEPASSSPRALRC